MRTVDRDAIGRPGSFGPVLGLFALAFLVLAWPWLSGGLTVPWDAKAHFLPQLQFLAGSIHDRQWPFWNPYVFAGHPQIADPQSLIFSPPYLLLALIDPAPGPWEADAVLYATLFAGGIAVLLLARDWRWHSAAGLVAALAFAFGGSAAWRIQHVGQILSLSYLPIAWWLLARALERRSALYGFGAGLVAGFMVLGRDQVAYLGLWVLTGVVLAHWIRDKSVRGTVLPLLAGLAGGLITALVPLVLTLLLYEQSNRLEITLDGALKGSLHPASLLTAVVPKLFGTAGPLADFWGPPSPAWGPVDLYLARNMGHVYLGAIPLVLMAALVWRGRSAFAGPLRLVAILLAVMLLYALGRYTPVFQTVLWPIPGVEVFRRPADATFPLGLLAALLAGGLTHRWLTDRATRPFRVLAVGVSVIVVLIGLAAVVAVAKDRLAYAAWPLAQAMLLSLVAAGSLALARRLGHPLAAAAILAVVMTGDLAWSNGPSESTALPTETFDVLRPDTANATIATLKRLTAATASPNRRDRAELMGIDFHWPNASMTHRLDHDLGYNPVRLAWYADATGAGDHIALPDQRSFSPLFPSYRSPLADLLGLRFIASKVPLETIDARLKPGDLDIVAGTPDAIIYENPRALPRVLFATSVETADFAALIRDGHWPTEDLARTVVLEQAPDPPLKPGARPGIAGITRYVNDEVVIAATSPDGGYVILNDVWQPWWFVEVDGQPAELLRADAIMRAVRLPPGAHEVRFVFRPLAGAWKQLMAMAANR